MKVLKALVGIVGILVLVGGILVAGDTSLADPAVEALGNDYLVVAVPAALAVLLVFVGLLFRAVSGISQADPPNPEGVPSVPTFGSELDEFVSGTPKLRTHLFGDGPVEMHERIREAAIRTEMRTNGLTREAATRRVDDGTWTDDRDAAAFCRPNGAKGGRVGGRVRAAVQGRTWTQYGAASAAEALVQRSDTAAAQRPAMNDGGSETRGDD